MAEAPTLAETIEKLFQTHTTPAGRELSLRHVANWCAKWLRERGFAKSFSYEYLRQLRNGEATNPTKGHLEALAAFFDVDPVIFYGSEKAQQIQEDLDFALMLKAHGVRSLAMRATGLTPANRAKVQKQISTLLRQQAADHDGD
ncbi:XRE family transcriptional regulator [Amycolatopsis roodepoortensis]|uniref:XRE family transcriptional regulator n=1 Tax=Amycolatopsis roodepoortensis TaxID=700274 RepID=UPI00214BD529|nr:XRE family transcriptional regulator [Amycolatopsis roodepoortensis]UUV32074.1 XRE family transcriptional regulator [Amycolatopsis roodepoortensis]